MNYIKKFESFSDSNVKIGDTVDIDMTKVQGMSTHSGTMAYDVIITNVTKEWPGIDMVEFELDGETYKAPMSAVKFTSSSDESDTDYDLRRQAEELQMSSPEYRGVHLKDIEDELKKRRF